MINYLTWRIELKMYPSALQYLQLNNEENKTPKEGSTEEDAKVASSTRVANEVKIFFFEVKLVIDMQKLI